MTYSWPPAFRPGTSTNVVGGTVTRTFSIQNTGTAASTSPSHVVLSRSVAAVRKSRSIWTFGRSQSHVSAIQMRIQGVRLFLRLTPKADPLRVSQLRICCIRQNDIVGMVHEASHSGGRTNLLSRV